MAIYFYSTREEPYGCFSNFSRHGFELDGLWWATSEHHYQAQKFVKSDRAWFDKIRQAIAPKEAAKMGRKGWQRKKQVGGNFNGGARNLATTINHTQAVILYSLRGHSSDG